MPSPYLTGLFDAYAEGWRSSLQGHRRPRPLVTTLPAAIIETNRGCPYGCTFCDWGSATLSRIRQVLDRPGLRRARLVRGSTRCSASGSPTPTSASSSATSRSPQKIADLKRTYGLPGHVRHQLRQEHDEAPAADRRDPRRRRHPHRGPAVAAVDGRRHPARSTAPTSSSRSTRSSPRSSASAELPLYVDLMMGLPGQTCRSFRNDLQECINREVHAKIFPTELLVNSPMNEPDYRELHGIVTEPGKRSWWKRDRSPRRLRGDAAAAWTFMVREKYGVLRFVARYVRHETGDPRSTSTRARRRPRTAPAAGP